MAYPVSLEKIRSLIEKGQIDTARSLAQNRSTRSITDANIHLEWAELLEDLELYDHVLTELNLAARDAPARPDICSRLADTYIDQGDFVRAGRALWPLLQNDPKNIEYYKEIGKILELGRHYDKALIVYQSGYDKTGNEIFKKLIHSLDFLSQDSPVDEETVEKADQILPSRHHLVTFSALFAGREGVYARQWGSPTGETGYTPVHEPLTIRTAENHILGNLTLGVYPVRMDNTVNFIAFDLDLPKFVVNKVISQESQWKRAMGRLHKTACQLIDAAAAHDIPLYLEDSGFKGRHCWIFLETPTPAGVAKKFGEILLSQLPQDSSEVSFEIFPKQGTVRKGSLGNLIKLPLGFHRKTGKRGLFIRPDGKPIESQLEFLENIEKTPRKSIYSFIQKLQTVSVVVKEVPVEKQETPPSLIPPQLVQPYDLEQDPQIQYILLKCPVLRRIVERINQSASLTKDENIVLTHTLGHLDNGPDAVNQLLKRCVNTNPTRFLQSRLKGNPISCPKIRSRIPHITSSVACNCTFNPSINMYPTPVIHVHTMSPHNQSSTMGLTVNSLQFQNLLQQYLDLRKQYRELTVMLTKYEDQIKTFFDKAGMDYLETPMGKLKQIKDSENRITYTLEMD
jgi:hypothetical protein